MFGKSISLFKLSGFTVKADLSWLIIALLITWSLAKGLFPHYFPGFSNNIYWLMGFVGAIGLFMSIIFHEFCHSIVARRFGLSMKGITLFIFGGVAEMESEPENPKTEFYMAIAGPLSSIFLGVFVYLILIAGNRIGLSKPLKAVLEYLMVINFVLAGFNLIPAFPLDGGRVLRSILWGWKKDLRWATHVSSYLGSSFGMFLTVWGVLNFITGNVINGMWYLLIGFFIKSASQMSYKRVLIRDSLAGEEISHFMNTNPVTVPPLLSIEQLVNDYFYKYHYKMFPVKDGDNLVGCITSKQVKDLPQQEWDKNLVEDIMIQCTKENIISPTTDALKALSIMNQTGNSRLMVMDNNQLVGIITLKDMLKFLEMKIDLGTH